MMQTLLVQYYSDNFDNSYNRKCFYASKYLTMYWLRKAVVNEPHTNIDVDLHKLNKDYEEELKSECAWCRKRLIDGKKCNRCKVAYYCNKKCQAEDWKTGHKLECIDENKKLKDWIEEIGSEPE